MALLIFWSTISNADSNCRTQQKVADTRLHVNYIIDGDTVDTDEYGHLRLIGVDTPEIGYAGKPTQAGAIKARDFLKSLLKQKREYSVHFGVESVDRYGRKLGHLFLTDGRNLQALLLRAGLAIPLAIPPNLTYNDCYQREADKAIQARHGLWKLPQYQATAAALLAKNASGYHVIYGHVSRIAQSKSSFWLNLGEQFAIRIARADLKYFVEQNLEYAMGRRLQVRGKVYKRKGQQRLQLRHSSDMAFLDN